MRENLWDGTVRNTRQGRSQASIEAQVQRALESTAGTDAYYKNYRRLLSVAQRYNENIRNEITKRATNSQWAKGNRTLSQYQRDYDRERLAMMSRDVYEGRKAKGNSNG